MKSTDPIKDNLNLTVRLRTCCKHAGFQTIGELISKTDVELMKYHRFGRQTIGEVNDLRSTVALFERPN